MAKLEKEVAEAEVNAWLDAKRIQPSHREGLKEQIEVLVDSFMDGVLVRDEATNELVHTLIWPLDKGEVKVESIKYKARINDEQIAKSGVMKGISPKDGDLRMSAYTSAITGQPRSVIQMLDSIDKRISLAITLFFLPG